MEFKDINNKEAFLTNVNEVCALLEAYSNKDFTGYDSKEDLIDMSK